MHVKKQSGRSRILLILALFLCFNLVHSQSKTDQFDQLINTYLQQNKFNGSVLVADANGVIYKKGFGYANMEWDIPNAANTKHRLGSITKQFTAMLIMQMVAEGKLDVQVPISTYLPHYPKPNADKITLHHLMTHTSGIPNYTSFPNFFKDESRNPFSPGEFVKKFSDKELDFAPGERFSYSNSGYFLLGYILEVVTNKSYEQLLQERIFTPLGMNDTGYDHHETIMKHRASGYEKRGIVYVNAPYLDMSIPYAAGSMYSTVEDLYKWDRSLYTEKLLPKKYLDMLFVNYMPSTDRSYGYGWSLDKIPVGNTGEIVNTIGHGGGINGFNTLITRVPSDKSLVVLLNNTGGAPLNAITEGLLAILYGKSYDLPKASVAMAVYDDILANGKASAMATFNKLKVSKDYALDENEMNQMGYTLLNMGKAEEAEALFKLNVDAFPDSFNVYDSYAESLMHLGKNDEAIQYYRKSVELYPGNTNGIDMLKKLGVNTDTLVEAVDVPETILETYVGTYALTDDFKITITREGKQLKAQATGQPQADIFPKSETVFYVKVVTAQLTFNKNEHGEVESLTLLQNGHETTGKKIE